MRDAHIAPHGEAKIRFKHSRNMFAAVAAPESLGAFLGINWETLSGRLKKTLTDVREASISSSKSFEIIEVRKEREVLPDDNMSQVSEAEEQKQTEGHGQTDPHERLRAAEDGTQNNALSRRKRKTSKEQKFWKSSSSVIQKNKQRTKTVSYKSNVEDVSLLVEQIKSRSALEQICSEIEQCNLEIGKARHEPIEARLQKHRNKNDKCWIFTRKT